MSAQHLLFEASGLLLAAPAELVKAIHEDLNIQAVVGSQHWFLGLAVAHGKLLPVTDLGAFVGHRPSAGRILELSRAIGMGGLQVDAVFGLSNAAVVDVPFTPIEASLISDGNLTLSNRAVVQEARTYRLLDVAALVQSPAFLNIAET